MTERAISVARDFSPFPFGRYRTEGPHSGEAFREDVLWPVLEEQESVAIVDLDGVKGGLGSSFLEEVFGGLVRQHGLSTELMRERVKIVSQEDPGLATRVWNYVIRASKPK
jgi:hypothetical protein